MAISSKAVIASLLISFLLFNFIEADQKTVNENSTGGVNGSPLQTIDCEKACAERCKLASKHKMCMRACRTCCQRCNCVPPGTYGNHDMCPCYASQTTHGGRKKCP